MSISICMTLLAAFFCLMLSFLLSSVVTEDDRHGKIAITFGILTLIWGMVILILLVV